MQLEEKRATSAYSLQSIIQGIQGQEFKMEWKSKQRSWRNACYPWLTLSLLSQMKKFTNITLPI